MNERDRLINLIMNGKDCGRRSLEEGDVPYAWHYLGCEKCKRYLEGNGYENGETVFGVLRVGTGDIRSYRVGLKATKA